MARAPFMLLMVLALGAAAGPLLASPCQGKLPAAGASLTGTVLHVIDNGRVCLADGPTPDAWTEVQLVGGSARPDEVGPASDKATLMRAAFARRMRCTVKAVVGGVAQAQCSLAPSPVNQQMASADGVKVAAWMGAPTY